MEWVIGLWVLVGVIAGWFWYRREKKSGVPKGNSGWPFVGETLDFIACGYTSQPVSFMDKRKSLFGKVFKTHILGKPVIVSTDPEVNKVVLQNHGNDFIPAYPKSITELLGKYSILQLNGNLQKKVHALLGGFLRSPQFKAQIARDIEKAVKLTLASWRDMRLTFVQQETRKITFGILVKVLMNIGPGEDLNFLKREFEEFIKGLICLPIKLPGTRLYKSLKAKERLLKRVTEIVEERKMAMEKSEEKGTISDTIDVLLRNLGDNSLAREKQSLPSDCIRDIILEMMIPGEETVPTAMTLAVKFLSDSPLALMRLTEENMELKRQKGGCSDGYGWTDYMSLPFTQNVINETLRMANIINGVWRKALRDVEIKGYLIPQGWCLLTSFISADSEEGHAAGFYLGDNADGEKLAKRVGPEFMNKLNEGFEELSDRVLPSPLDDAYLDAMHTNFLIEFEPEYLMEEFGTNPDIDDKPPIPLRDALEKMKPFLMAYEGIQSQEEWEEAIDQVMERVPLLKEIVDHYSGPDRVTAKQQQEELDRVAKTIPESAPASVQRFANRAVLSLQSNPGWGFDKKCQFMDKVVWEVSQHYK